MKNGRDGRPNWLWIKDEIQRSKAFFLILTKNIVKNEHAQNWVAFEIGVASTRNPRIPVIVFREENVDFPVPYLSHYYDQPLSNTNHLLSHDFSLTVLNVLIHAVMGSIVDGVIKQDIDMTKVDEASLKCSNYLLRFLYCGTNEEFNCPCCSKLIIQDLSHDL